MPLRELPSSPPNKNKSLRDLVEADLPIPHPASMKRGVTADRHETWVRDAMDAGAPGAIVARTSGTFADGEVAWSWRPDAGVKPAMMLRITLAMVATKPGHQGEREGNR